METSKKYNLTECTMRFVNSPDQIKLDNVSFISFSKEQEGLYNIETYAWVGKDKYKMLAEFLVVEKDLATVLPPSIAEYIEQASKLNVPIGALDTYGLETDDWKYGWHAVPIQHEPSVSQEYAQALNLATIKETAMAPNRINDVDITSEQQNLLRRGELVILNGVSNGSEKKMLALWVDKENGFRMMEVPAAMENAPLSEIERLTKVPTKINGVSLSDEQRINLADGKVVNVPSAGNPSKTVGVKMSDDGQPLVVPPARQAHKQELAKPGMKLR